jgi:hypothetical protein
MGFYNTIYLPVRRITVRDGDMSEAVSARPDRVGTRMIGTHGPEDLLYALRVLAAKNQTTMEATILRALVRALEKGGEPVPQGALDALERIARTGHSRPRARTEADG